MTANPIDETEREAIVPSSQRPKVVESFSEYTPPFEARPIVERMLASVPAKYLIGLKEVVLTNSSGRSRKFRRSVTSARGRKVRIVEARGLYHQAWQGKQARIEIFVDNCLKGWEKGLWLRIPLIREGRLSEVLFHEVGHHIHFTARPEYREKEDVADVWMVRLEQNYTRRRFRWLRLVIRLFAFISGPLFQWQRAKLLQSELRKGRISRAEFEERLRKKSRDPKDLLI